jgi:ubiquinone/menaquinone biosynthesis C-methylase UbiE
MPKHLNGVLVLLATDTRVTRKGESLDRLLVLAAPQPGWRLLNVATGGGHTALAFAPRVREVVATDLTPDRLAAPASYIRGLGAANVVCREADAIALPFDDGEFDLVTCRVAPHHFPDRAQFVREMARVLRPGAQRPSWTTWCPRISWRRTTSTRLKSCATAATIGPGPLLIGTASSLPPGWR